MRIYIDTTTYGHMADVNLSPFQYPFSMSDLIKGKKAYLFMTKEHSFLSASLVNCRQVLF